MLLVWEVAARLIGGAMVAAHPQQRIALWLAGEGTKLFPPFTTVLIAMIHDIASLDLPVNLAITLGRVIAAFAISMLLGTALGLAMGTWRRLDFMLDSWVTALLNLPALVVIVLMYVWFGLTEAAAIAAVTLNKLPTTAVVVREGARAVDRNLMEMAHSFRMRRWTTLRHVALPQLYPYLFAAARSGLAIIWKIVLVVELLGRSDGVGFQIQIYFQLFDVTHILAYTLAFILVVQAIEWALLQPMERRATRWRR